jgi:hypothetical protein
MYRRRIDGFDLASLRPDGPVGHESCAAFAMTMTCFESGDARRANSSRIEWVVTALCSRPRNVRPGGAERNATTETVILIAESRLVDDFLTRSARA